MGFCAKNGHSGNRVHVLHFSMHIFQLTITPVGRYSSSWLMMIQVIYLAPSLMMFL